MFIESIKHAYAHWSTRRKVEPPKPIDEEFPLEKEEEEAVIVEIEFDDANKAQKLPSEYTEHSGTKHTLSIWV